MRLLVPPFYASDLHDDFDVLALAQGTVDERLAEVFASGEGSADRCWLCGRPGAAIDCAQSEGGRLLFEQPVLCDVCVGLSGHVGGGFATVDEEWQMAVEQAFETLARDLDAPTADLRERADELVLAKLAVVGAYASDNSLAYPGAGMSELASGLGLSEAETRAQIMRMFEQPDSPVTFRRIDGAVGPGLSGAGQQRLDDLVREYRLGPPYANAALRSASLRRALSRLEPAPILS
jgi:hypothetical protein